MNLLGIPGQVAGFVRDVIALPFIKKERAAFREKAVALELERDVLRRQLDALQIERDALLNQLSQLRAENTALIAQIDAIRGAQHSCGSDRRDYDPYEKF